MCVPVRLGGCAPKVKFGGSEPALKNSTFNDQFVEAMTLETLISIPPPVKQDHASVSSELLTHELEHKGLSPAMLIENWPVGQSSGGTALLGKGVASKNTVVVETIAGGTLPECQFVHVPGC